MNDTTYPTHTAAENGYTSEGRTVYVCTGCGTAWIDGEQGSPAWPCGPPGNGNVHKRLSEEYFRNRMNGMSCSDAAREYRQAHQRVETTPAEREAVDAVSRLGQQHPTPELTAAEQTAATAIRDIGSWEYCNDEPDPRMAYREWLARLSRDVVAKVRPHLYREAAARLRDVCDRNGHGGDCCLTCDRGSDVDLLESLAGEMDQARAAEMEGRGDDH